MTLSQVLIDENKKLIDENNQLKAKVEEYKDAKNKLLKALESKLGLAEDMGLVISAQASSNCICLVNEYFKDL